MLKFKCEVYDEGEGYLDVVTYRVYKDDILIYEVYWEGFEEFEALKNKIENDMKNLGISLTYEEFMDKIFEND